MIWGIVMKNTIKMLALVLSLMMLVSCFVACGDKPVETTAEQTTEKIETTQVETTQPVETTEKVCDHKNKLKKTGIVKAPTCVEEGYTEYICQSCKVKVQAPIEKVPHSYSQLPSIDGQYVKYVCYVCMDSYVTNKEGVKIEDASAISFPLFFADFEGVNKLEDYTALYPDYTFDLAKSYANVVKNNPNGEKYLNIPTGNYGIAQNGRLCINDTKNSLVGGFTLSFSMQFPNFPKDKMPLVTWGLDGKDYVLLSIDDKGNVYNAADTKIGTSKDKGWDTVEIKMAADGNYTVTLNGATAGTGSVTVTGTTGSTLTFMGLVSEFEAYFDNIGIAK